MKALNEIKITQNWGAYLKYRSRKIRGVLSGIPSIDKYLLGLGGMVVLQGSTKSSKSTLALQIVHNNLKLGNPCIFIDAENGEGRLRSRLMCQANQVTEIELMGANSDQLKAYRAPLMEYPLYIYTEPIMDQEELALRIKEALDLHPAKPLILLIDSIQAMYPLGEDQRVSLEKWVYFFDRLKVQYDGRLTIIVVSELNRSSYDTAKVGGAKGSNSIEYKAECLLDCRADRDSSDIWVEVLANRDGNKGARFRLEKVMKDPNNDRSFTFMLRAVNDIEGQ